MIQSKFRGWDGPPIGLQILGLLVGALIVAQLTTLLLTLLLPPQPPPLYSLDDIAAGLRGRVSDRLERKVQSGPPDITASGWLVSESSRGKLATKLGVPANRVTLAFYTRLPLGGQFNLAPPLLQRPGPPPSDMRPANQAKPAKQPARPTIGLVSTVPVGGLIDLRANFLEGEGQAVPGAPAPGGFPGGMPGGGGMHGGFPGGGFPHGGPPPRTQIPTDLPQARPPTPRGPDARPPMSAPTQAPGQGGGQRPQGTMTPVETSRAPAVQQQVPTALSRPVLSMPQIVPFPILDIPRAIPVQSPPSRRETDAVPEAAAPVAAPQTVSRPAEPVHTVPPAEIISAAPPQPFIPADAVPVSTPTAGALPIRAPSRGLFGLSPSPFVEGDFVAAVQQPDGQWVVVAPKAEGFPNAWQRRVLLWFVLSLALVAPVAWAFARRIVRPLQGFADAAETLGRDPSAAILPLSGPAEIGRAAHAFNQMQSRLRAFVDDRTAMVGAISHDLRTPLTRLRFRIEDVPDEQQEGLLEEVADMETMISQVIEFIRDASTPGVRERLDLGELVQIVARDAKMIGGDVTVESVASAPVEVDAVGVRRLLDNLLENALKYGERARIRLSIEDGEAVARIEDDGPGIPHDEIERAFEPFYRSVSARASDKAGTGLGLAVCRSIARAHGGDIRLGHDAAKFVAQVNLPLAYEGLADAA